MISKCYYKYKSNYKNVFQLVFIFIRYCKYLNIKIQQFYSIVFPINVY